MREEKLIFAMSAVTTPKHDAAAVAALMRAIVWKNMPLYEIQAKRPWGLHARVDADESTSYK
jgi:hypothetical protein